MREIGKVSIYIPTHNRVSLLVRAVFSALNQSYKDIEVIVSDDGSSDTTPHVIEQLMKVDSRLRYVRSDIAKGANHARNKAIENATGIYVTGLDDDDFFLPNRIENFVKHYRDDYAFMYSQRKVISSKGERDSQNFVGRLTLRRLLAKNVVGNQIFARKEMFELIDGYDVSLSAWQDYDCWVRLLLKHDEALGLNCVDYVMDTTHESERISASVKALQGATIFYDKYSEMMTKCQKKTLASEIFFMKNQSVGIADAFNLVNKDNYKKIFYNLYKHYVR